MANKLPPHARLQSRLNELEAKIAFGDDLLESLNRTVYLQQQQIDRLQQAVRALREYLQQSLPVDAGNPADDVPPHF